MSSSSFENVTSAVDIDRGDGDVDDDVVTIPLLIF